MPGWIAFYGGPGWQIDRERLVFIGRLLALIVIALATRLALRSPRGPASEASSSLDGLRAGAAIYIGAFVLGSNFDYRMLLVGLCLPALFQGLAGASTERRFALPTLIAFGLTVWPNGLFWKPLVFVNSPEAGPCCFSSRTP